MIVILTGDQYGFSYCNKTFQSHNTQRNTEAVGIAEGDMVKMKVVEGEKIMIEKADKEVWKNCTDFLPADFENIAIAASFLL